MIHVIGGGLAGCEAAWQAARAGARVTIHEMRPAVSTAVHKTDRLAELVCSNSFRGDKLDNAVGLLKEEMRRLGSIVMQVADSVRVPAGAALAVDREAFAEGMTIAIGCHPLISIDRREVPHLPSSAEMSPVIVATGPLTSSALSADIAAFVGQAYLAFFDAISPIVLAESIDQSKVFRASRWNRSLRAAEVAADADGAPRAVGVPSAEVAISAELAPSAEAAAAVDEGDYLNCPMSKDEYLAFHAAIVSAEKAEIHDFDGTKFFEGCLPIEVMAHRGVDTLRFGPMKPAGLPTRAPVAGPMRWCSCARTTWPATTSASWAFRRSSSGASRPACCA